MLGQIFRSHRQKCSDPDMECNEGVGKLPQDLLGKVKTGSGRGKRAGRTGKNSLVTDVISLIAFAPDVGR